MLSKEECIILLTIARKSIETKKNMDLNSFKITENLKEKKGCFVTLTINEELRGCIGYILPVKPLYEAVFDNAYNAAYKDYRFPPLSNKEFKEIEIEISVLTIPQKVEYFTVEDLKSKIKPYEDGVIIKSKNEFYSATFLPQVWEQLDNFEDFFSHLCLKAGLSPDEWKKCNLIVEKYNVFKFCEKDFSDANKDK